ncbi:MAG: hypothetical protein RL368_2274 [Pseudomonadota bacterium]
MISLKLSELVPALHGVIVGEEEIEFQGISTDTRQIKLGNLYVALSGKHFDGHDFILQAQQNGAVAAIVDRAVTCSLPTLRVADTRKALGDLAKLWRQRFPVPVVAVTGSNGKTTVKEMLRAILSERGKVLATEGNLNNDIGLPLTLFNLNQEYTYAVVEMGANHAGEIAYLSQIAQPQVAVITLCAPAHLEGFKDVEGVAHAKGEIFSGLQAQGTAIINQDDVYANLWQELAKPRAVSRFAIEETADVRAKNLQLAPESCQFILQTRHGEISIQLPLAGRHNVLNALAASAAALALGCTLENIQSGLRNIQAVKGRLQSYPALNDACVLDDTYNANPTSLNAALSVLQMYPAPRWLVLGDMNELGERSALFHQQAARRALDVGVERLYATGNMTRHAVDTFGEGAYFFNDQGALIEALRNDVMAGTTLLVKGSRGMQMEKVVNALRVERQEK